MKDQILLNATYGRKKGTLRGASTSPLAFNSPRTIIYYTQMLIKRIIKIGEKSKRF